MGGIKLNGDEAKHRKQTKQNEQKKKKKNNEKKKRVWPEKKDAHTHTTLMGQSETIFNNIEIYCKSVIK